jgi:hypothetical protein
MPTFDVRIFLASGGTIDIRQTALNGNAMIDSLKRELAKQDECKLTARQEGIVVVLKQPNITAVGFSIDQVD